MNRADVVRQVLIWEQVAAAAQAKAAQFRQMLNADAVAEYTEQGTAPTWRMPEVATVSMPVSRTRPIVSDPDALAAWVARRHPTEVVQAVRPTFARALPGLLRMAGDTVIDPETGEVVPGMTVSEGGTPGSLRIVPTDEARQLISAHAADVVAAIEGAFNEPTGGDPA